MRSHKLVLVAAALSVLGTTAACGNGDNSSTKDDSYSIGIVQFSSSEEASEAALGAYVDYAEGQGWDVSKVDPQGSVDKAIGAMNDFVQKDVDLLVVTVFPSTSLTAGIKTANAAGIPVLSFAGGPGDGVVMDMDAGRPNAVELAKQVVTDLDGQGELLFFGNNAGLPCVGREAQVMDELASTDINVTRNEFPIPGQVEAATRFTQAWIAKNPEGSGPLAIVGCMDEVSLGAVSALRQAGRDDVLVYGINGTPAALEAVKAGDMRAVSVVDVVLAGTTVAEQTPDLIEAGVDAEAEVFPIPSTLVTTDTYEEFASQSK